MVEKTLTFARKKIIDGKKNKIKKKDLAKERKTIGLVLGVTIGLSFIFYLSTNWQKPKFNLKLPQLSSFKNSIINLNPQGKKSPEQLQAIINPLIKGQENNWAIWVEEVEGDFIWSHQPKTIFPAASLTKLPTAATLYQQIQKGERQLTEEMTLAQEDIRGGEGSLNTNSTGFKVNLEKLVFLSLNQSDNTASTMIKRLLTDQAISRNAFGMGMVNTCLEENTTTAQDTALFFKKLYQQEIFNQKYTNKFMENLTNTDFENRIPKGVPQGVKVAHKVGSDTKVAADAGLVLVPEKPIILVFLSKNINYQEAEKLIVDLTREIYWFLVSSD